MFFTGFNLSILRAFCSTSCAGINLGCYKGLFKHRMSMEWLSGIPIIFSEVGCSVLVQESISSSDRLRVVKKLLTSLWLKLQLI